MRARRNRFRETIGIKERLKGARILHLRHKPAHSAKTDAENDSFGAMIHSSDPILRLKDGKTPAAWQKDLALNCSCAVLVTTALALFCMCIDSPELIPFALPCAAVFMIIVTIGSVKPGVLRWLAAGVAAVILMGVAIIWHGAIFEGIGMLVNRFYDSAEDAQAYIYERLPAGDYATEGAGRAGLAWASAVIGLIMSLPPVKLRHLVSALTAISIMLAFAYYGLLPSAVCIAVMIAALMVAVSRSSIMAVIPVVLASLLLFGAVVLVNPGENYGISRMDENFRDRFALKSALVEDDSSFYDDGYDDFDEEVMDEEDEEYEEETEEESGYGAIALYGLLILIVAAIGIAAFILIRRFLKKRAMNRKGINSQDAREAVTAMFPYAVRWLKGYGIEQADALFVSMVPSLKKEFPDDYVKRFADMYNVWSEAAYSDHSVTESTRVSMEAFTKDTVDEVYKRCGLRDKLRLRLRHAL